MKIKIEIDCSSDAFFENPHIEVSRILEELSIQVNCNGIYDEQKIFDINGNSIGYVKSIGENL